VSGKVQKADQVKARDMFQIRTRDAARTQEHKASFTLFVAESLEKHPQQ
jgi:hypothetical protein